jgi:hypothetical protein
MAKDKAINPAQAQRKLEKQKAVKKGWPLPCLFPPADIANLPLHTGKAEAAARRTERLARRNPERLQRQLDELKVLEASAGRPLNAHEKKQLEELERDVKAVRKAREILGDRAPVFGGVRGGREGGVRHRGEVLGKRRRDPGNAAEAEDEDSDDAVPEDVRNIPMPTDEPPPIPQEYLDKYRRRRRGGGASDNPNLMPLGDGAKVDLTLPRKPDVTPTPSQTQTVYEAKPVIRNLQKEAVSAFMPTAVQRKIQAQKGEGRLLEPEEVEKLEREGYGSVGGKEGVKEAMEAREGLDEAERHLEEEAERFRREMRHVQMEEVEDEDA